MSNWNEHWKKTSLAGYEFQLNAAFTTRLKTDVHKILLLFWNGIRDGTVRVHCVVAPPLSTHKLVLPSGTKRRHEIRPRLCQSTQRKKHHADQVLFKELQMIVTRWHISSGRPSWRRVLMVWYHTSDHAH